MATANDPDWFEDAYTCKNQHHSFNTLYFGNSWLVFPTNKSKYKKSDLNTFESFDHLTLLDGKGHGLSSGGRRGSTSLVTVTYSRRDYNLRDALVPHTRSIPVFSLYYYTIFTLGRSDPRNGATIYWFNSAFRSSSTFFSSPQSSEKIYIYFFASPFEGKSRRSYWFAFQIPANKIERKIQKKNQNRKRKRE